MREFSVTRVIQLLVVLSAALFAFIFGNEAGEIYLVDLMVLLMALTFILLVQSAILVVLHGFMAARGAGRRGEIAIAIAVVAAVFVTANAYYTAFCTFDAAHVVQIAMSVAIGLLFLGIVWHPRSHGIVLFMLPAYFVLSLGLYSFTRYQMLTPARAADNPLRVQSKRNVYLIGNESLGSPKAIRELYGMKNLPHEDYLRSRGFRLLDRAYAADYKTLRTFSRMLDFGKDISDLEIENRAVFNYPNAAFNTFHRSGYKIQFMFMSSYFALNPALVDHAFPSGAAFTTCVFLPKHFFYFLCHPRIRDPINYHIFGFKSLKVKAVEDRVGVTSRSGQPWLTIYHKHYPFHTLGNHDYRDAEAVRRFRAKMRDALPQVRERNFDTIVEAIRRYDPGAVIVAFGDHGASLTRGADLDEPNPVFTQSQILEDRFGVLLAVYPRDFCVKRLSEGTSTVELVRNVVRCLNGDDAPTPAQRAESRTIHWKGPRSLDRYPTAAVAPGP